MFHSVGVYPLNSLFLICRLSSLRKKLSPTEHHPGLSKVTGTIFVMSVTPVTIFIFPGVPTMDTKALAGDLSFSISRLITGSSINNSYVKTIPSLSGTPQARTKRSVPSDPKWNPDIQIPPRGAADCTVWRDIGIGCLTILILEFLGGILALALCCCRRG